MVDLKRVPLLQPTDGQQHCQAQLASGRWVRLLVLQQEQERPTWVQPQTIMVWLPMPLVIFIEM